MGFAAGENSKRRGWDSNPHTLARAGFQDRFLSHSDTPPDSPKDDPKALPDQLGSHANPLVPEQPPARKHHGDPMLIGSLDDLFVSNRASGLHNGFDPSLGGGIHPIPEGEEGV